jgi:oxepin-CoA hydrolase/3-oxo-5,6-dehydrosuberyl-CoA semialdehyde dehydrogenase
MKIESYACGAWTPGSDDGVEVRNAINGEPIGHVSSTGLDFADMLTYGRDNGGSALRNMPIHDRANMLKALAKHLLGKKELFYAVSAKTGATRADSWVDIEGGIGTVFAYSGIARRELPNETFAVEGPTERLSPDRDHGQGDHRFKDSARRCLTTDLRSYR